MFYTSEEERRGLHLKAGDRHYRTWVGHPETYDVSSATQFSLITNLGLRDNHDYLDIGCGSLRGGRLFIVYLLPRRYHGIEPNHWALEEGIENELGDELIRLKQPSFDYNSEFDLSVFDKKFDFILAQSIFSHASENMVRTCLREAKEVMKSTSIFVASFVRNNSDKRIHQGWVYPDCCHYSIETMKRMIEDSGLNCELIDWFHIGRTVDENSNRGGWQWIKITK